MTFTSMILTCVYKISLWNVSAVNNDPRGCLYWEKKLKNYEVPVVDVIKLFLEKIWKI